MRLPWKSTRCTRRSPSFLPYLSLSPSRRRRGQRTSLVAQMQPSPALQLSLSLSIFFTPPRTLLPPRYNLESSASSPNWKFFWHQIARSNCTPRFLSRLLDSMVRPPPLEHCESATHSRESHRPHRRERDTLPMMQRGQMAVKRREGMSGVGLSRDGVDSLFGINHRYLL